MATEAYNRALEQIRQLSHEEQCRLLADLSAEVDNVQVVPKPQRSILEFEGLGKEIWEGIDADRYIENERNSWE